MIKISVDRAVHMIEIREDWNWVVSKKLEPLTQEAKHLVINLEHCRLMDSEAIILICKWLKNKKEIKLINVPEIYFDIIKILNLEEHLAHIKISKT